MICVEAPGLAPGDVSLEIHGQTLRLSGKRERSSAPDGSYHRRERWAGEFSRALELPRDADPSAAEARCKDGVLVVRIPKHEHARPRQIVVRGD